MSDKSCLTFRHNYFIAVNLMERLWNLYWFYRFSIAAHYQLLVMFIPLLQHSVSIIPASSSYAPIFKIIDFLKFFNHRPIHTAPPSISKNSLNPVDSLVRLPSCKITECCSSLDNEVRNKFSKILREKSFSPQMASWIGPSYIGYTRGIRIYNKLRILYITKDNKYES